METELSELFELVVDILNVNSEEICLIGYYVSC